MQIDSDQDGTGDECDEDRDGDGLSNVDEQLWGLDPDDSDTDGDGTSDGIEFGCTPDCPPEPLNTDPTSPIDALSPDSDGDGVRDEDDNCRLSVNLEQTDLDGDGQGDACDIDVDGDGIRAEYDCDDANEKLALDSEIRTVTVSKTNLYGPSTSLKVVNLLHVSSIRAAQYAVPVKTTLNKRVFLRIR